LKARFRYYDFGQKKHEEFTTEPVKVSLVCPILNSREITQQQWEYTIGNLVHATETFTGVPMSSAALEAMLSQTLREFNLHPVPPQYVSDSAHEIGTRQRFFAIGVKGTPYAVQLEITGGQGTMSNVTITAWSASPQTLVGFYHGLLDAIEKRVHIRDHLKGKVIIREVEGDYVAGQRVGVEDSVILRSQIGASKQPPHSHSHPPVFIK
ncbi:hypothetical protein KA005_76640, partial [bacterium]|nr:hypothetical protein [bacterium]